jgi:hypothetical protein
LLRSILSATPASLWDCARCLPFWQRVPSLRGSDLHHQIVEFQPEIKVLFMSGYAKGLPDMKLPRFRFSALLESLRELQSRD